MSNTRIIAATIVCHVIQQKRPLDKAIAEAHLSSLTQSDKSFVNSLCYGTIRWHIRLIAISKKLLFKSLPEKHQDVLCLLLVALYQLTYLNTPEYAAISETVNSLKIMKKKWACGLANKILRLFCVKKSDILSEVDQHEQQRYAHPTWLLQQIKHDWPQQWQAILTANNQPAPMTIRVNPQFNSTDDYLKVLENHNINARRLEQLPFAIQLDKPTTVDRLPSFSDGWCYIQDEAGQHAAQLLQLTPGISVLDACCAPGSKTTDILLTEPRIKKLVAVDKNPARLERVKENLARLKINHQHIELMSANITALDSWWNKQLFDRILIDAPCTASGVIRRHPDIKVLKTYHDIATQAEQQQRMLNTLWPLLKPGGLLLYSTCSMLKTENQANIDTFLLAHQHDIAEHKNQQFFPTINGCDGFFYSLIKKKFL